jgi:hypothetical protein
VAAAEAVAYRRWCAQTQAAAAAAAEEAEADCVSLETQLEGADAQLETMEKQMVSLQSSMYAGSPCGDAKVRLIRATENSP